MKKFVSALILSIFMSLAAEAKADCQKVKDYYKSVNPKAEAKYFREQINRVITAGHITIPYGGLWASLDFTDADADDTGVVLLYTQRIAPSSMAQNIAGAVPGAWNREHVWPQSRGLVPGTSPYSDLHHIRPADRIANQGRGHKNFGSGEVNVFGSLGNLAGKKDTNSFEPKEDVKGNVARMLFYMTVRYPALELIKKDAGVNSIAPKIGKLCTLMKWHQKDAVSAFERKRNTRVCQRQRNRNPFIDHPKWALKLWGKTCGIKS